MINRRDFLLAGSATMLQGCALFKSGSGDFDENLAVFLADPHVFCGNLPAHKEWIITQNEIARRVAEILAMSPLPRNVVLFGDIAFDHGELGDYRIAAEKLKLLTDAGIRVTIGTGNHDRRHHFIEVFPEYAKTTTVDGRIVSVVSLGHCDLILLDSLKGKDEDTWHAPVEGELNEPQQEWLADYLGKSKRPVLVGAHHPVHELKVMGQPLAKLLANSAACCGYVNGHDHEWRRLTAHGGHLKTIRTLYLPSSGLWGDIGSVVVRTYSDRAVATLHQNDYRFHRPLVPGDKRPAAWDQMLAENKGQTCTFLYN